MESNDKRDAAVSSILEGTTSEGSDVSSFLDNKEKKAVAAILGDVEEISESKTVDSFHKLPHSSDDDLLDDDAVDKLLDGSIDEVVERLTG